VAPECRDHTLINLSPWYPFVLVVERFGDIDVGIRRFEEMESIRFGMSFEVGDPVARGEAWINKRREGCG